jgi:alpha-glucosidase (family GH31 glycosyl hydrolase)
VVFLASLALIGVGAFSAAPAAQSSVAPSKQSQAAAPIVVAGRKAQLTLSAIRRDIVRLQLSPLESKEASGPAQEDLALVVKGEAGEKYTLRSLSGQRSLRVGNKRVTLSANPLTVAVKDPSGRLVQQLQFDKDTGAFTFMLGDGPIFGLGEGGPQFDRRGSTYPMKSGQGVADLKVNGARVPIPWLIGTAGWAMFVHTPRGSYDLTGKEGRFMPSDPASALPVDVFIVATGDPVEIMKGYAQLTGYPHMPPLWALGYQQSHRTLASREEVVSEAKTFREKKLPCDVFIFLGTGFCPSGWNTGHGSFTFNERVFPDPEEIFRELHAQNLHVVLHVVNPPLDLHGTVNDTGAEAADASDAANVWAKHLEVFRLGVDGWWPDEGDRLDIQARLVRNRLYWDGPQKERPNLRPYALHRNGYAGMQRYAWLWSGDVDSTWQTLAAQVPVGINTSLSGEPFWGTDTGGFVTTPELTGELYVRWFQFSAFCPLFRSHGRTWKLRLPWGWNMGDPGPVELERYKNPAGLPDSKEFHNPEVEPICRKYLDLRYRLMAYLYSAVREAHKTGLPIMRALWLHYSDDPRAAERGDEYLWGRDILVAPVTEKGASSRPLYLPHGTWYDFWTEDKIEGGHDISRPVDLATMPLYVRAGAIIPMGPVKQYTTEKVDGPLTLVVYPGANGEFALYEDDGTTFNFEKGESSRLRLTWNDSRRTLNLQLEKGSRVLARLPRKIEVRLVPEKNVRAVEFTGKPMDVKF